MDSKLTGKIIQQKRNELGLTQIQLAQKLNVSNRTISKWEKGDGYPDVSLLENISMVLDISIDELLTGAKPEKEIEYVEVEKETNDDKSKLNFTIMSIIGFVLLLGQTVACVATEIALLTFRPFYLFVEIYLLSAVIIVYVVSVIIYLVGFARYKYNNELNYKSKISFWLFVLLATVSPVAIAVRMMHWYVEFAGIIILSLWVIFAIVLVSILIKRVIKNEKDN